MSFSQTRSRVITLALTASFVGVLFFYPAYIGAQQDNNELVQNLKQLDQEISALRATIRELQQRASTLEDELFLFANHIRQTELEIERVHHEIAVLDQKIITLDAIIAQRKERIARKKDAIAIFLRELNAYETVPPVVRIAASPSMIDALQEAAAIEQAQERLLARIADIREEAQKLLHEQELFEAQRLKQEELVRVAQLAREELRVKEFERERLLLETKGSEKLFSQLISKKTQEAASIRTTLYLLEDIGVNLHFEDAYRIAKQYANAVGIHASFLLAVLQKESRLGAHVGTGYWQTDMHPRDWPAFFEIARELGLDPDRTPVSKKPSYGWGGAMGPAQFLPSTWAGWKERIAVLTGNNPPSPWNIPDAFAAAALKLAAAGSDQKTFDAEWKAAMIYFAGGNWDNPAFSFYGDSVMALSYQFAEQIKILETEAR